MRRIISCYFAGAGTGDRWPRLARVFEHTARTHSPEWQLQLTKLSAPRRRLNQSDNHSANALKLEHWCDAVRSANDGDELLLIDADAFIVRPLDDIWVMPFDVAYTVRPPGYPMPLNGGVVFLRVSSSTRQFMATWGAANAAMLLDRALLAKWRKYQGINQRALGMLIEEGLTGLHSLLDLPCAEWNSEDSAWSSFDPAFTRIVHVKSELRDAVFPSKYHPCRKPHLKAIARIWEELERDALSTEARRA